MAGENENGGTDKGANGNQDTVAKVDYDAKVAEISRISQEMEDMRLEVFSPEYMEYLDNKDKGRGGAGKDAGKPPITEDIDIEKLSKKELLELASKQAEARFAEKIEAAKHEAVSTVDKSAKQREVAAFARGHEDYETYRPIMYGLSLDPKNKDLTLGELYERSKEHVSRIRTTPSKEEKERQAKLASEKPGGDSQSYEKYQKMSPESIAKEAAQEVRDKLGPIPQG